MSPQQPAPEAEAPPLVTIGMPVFNGAGTLARALESLLSQDYAHFELIISDNTSTDATGEICRAFAARDSRIAYIRQPANRGPSWNFNYVVGLARGKYFMRMSHDDIRAPTYLSKCVALLEATPHAVLCHSYTAAFYGDPESVLCILTHDTVVGIVDPRQRFMRALRHLPASAVDGVFRTAVLRTKTRLFGPYISSDIVLTHELSLHGEFVQVPEVLFWRSGKAVLPSPQDVQRFIGQGGRLSTLKLPFLVLLANHLWSIRRSSLGPVDKAVLSLQVIAHECGMVITKAAFRCVTAAMGDGCPLWILRMLIAPTNNPNVRVLKAPRDLPPVLHPTWRLLNHRNMEKALALQQKLDARLYPSQT